MCDMSVSPEVACGKELDGSSVYSSVGSAVCPHSRCLVAEIQEDNSVCGWVQDVLCYVRL